MSCSADSRICCRDALPYPAFELESILLILLGDAVASAFFSSLVVVEGVVVVVVVVVVVGEGVASPNIPLRIAIY